MEEWSRVPEPRMLVNKNSHTRVEGVDLILDVDDEIKQATTPNGHDGVVGKPAICMSMTSPEQRVCVPESLAK